MPKGTLTRVLETTFLKLVKIPCAVSGRRYATDEPSVIAPTDVWNMRLKSRGAVSVPGSPVAGDGTSAYSEGSASVKSRSGESCAGPSRLSFLSRAPAALAAAASMSAPSSNDT